MARWLASGTGGICRSVKVAAFCVALSIMTSAWCAEPAKSQGGAAADAQVSGVESPAVRCLAPALEQRTKPVFPPDMLRVKEYGTVEAELVFSAPDKAPDVHILNLVQPAFEDAVRDYAKALRVPCMAPSGGAVKLRQDFVFDPNDGRKVAWTTPVDAVSGENKCVLSLPSPKDVGIDYPNDMLRQGREGIVVTRLRFTAADQPPSVQVLFNGGHRHFVTAVEPYFARLRLPCVKDQPVEISVHYRFKLVGGDIRRRVLNDLSLAQFLAAVKPIPPGSAYFDTTRMKCPFDVRFKFEQPFESNQISQLDEDVVERHAFLDWLASQRMEVDAGISTELLDETMTIHVPCATINL